MRTTNNIVRRQLSAEAQQRQRGKKDYVASLGDSRDTRSAWKRAKDTSFASAYPGFRADKSLASSEGAYDAGTLGRDLKLAEALRQSREELRQLSLQLLSIQEWERQRIAADLHDGIGQSLSLVKISLESAIRQLKAEGRGEATESLHESLRLVARQLKDTMTELHRTAMDLRPSILDDLGIIPTLSWFFREFEPVWQGKKMERDISITVNDVPDCLKTAIFRILQEAMHNVVKHAHANRIRVSLKVTGRVLIFQIEDDGVGFDAAGLPARRAGGGFGMLTMRERARASDGTFTLKSAPGRGTSILVSWRLADGASRDAQRPQGEENAETRY